MVDQKIIEEFVEQIKPDNKESNKTHSAIVSKIDEEGTVWVRVAGSDKDTPTQLVGSEVKKGDAVNVEWRNNKLYIASNYSNPAAGVGRVEAVEQAAQLANEAANNAVLDAGRAKEAADSASASAEQARKDAGSAKESAENASEYAARALGNLSTVQSVTETLNWITAHGTMTITTDTALDPTHVYFVRDNEGDYEVGSYRYSIVTEPKLEDISTYYVLSIDESLNNYVGTHLAVTSEGLWILPEGLSANSYKILIATGGQGHTYEDAGTYIIDSAGKTVAKLGEVITLGDNEAQAYLYLDYHSIQLKDKNNNINSVYFHVSDIKDEEGYVTEEYVSDGVQRVFIVSFPLDSRNDMHMYVDDTEITGFTVEVEFSTIQLNSGTPTPAQGKTIKFRYKPEDGVENAWTRAFTFGWRRGNIGDNIGGLSFSEGDGNVASGWCAHAEGEITRSLGEASHAEGADTEAGDVCHAEGLSTVASGRCSHAQNRGTKAVKEDQTVIGRYNKVDTASLVENQKAFIIGNGTSGNRSNALTVDWQGNVDIASGAKYKINGRALSASDVSALPTSGGTITGDLTVNGDATLEGVTYLGLDVDSSASKTTPATSGEDKDLFNAIRDLGWYDDVIS